MQFITTDQRIAVENFEIGLIYTVTFTSGSYFIGACIGKGANYVMFQRTAPELIFSLTMAAAADVASIEPLGSDIGKILEYTGSVPVSIKTNGSPLLECTIKGNDLPGTGDKTANLFDNDNIDGGVYSIQSSGNITTGNTSYALRTKCEPNTTYVLSFVLDNDVTTFWRISITESTDYPIGTEQIIGRLIAYDSAASLRNKSTVITTGNNDAYIWVQTTANVSEAIFTKLMLNTGSTAKPFEPFGVKIPILSGDTTTNIYLDNPLRKSLDGTAVDELSSNGKLTQRVGTDGSVLSTPIISYIDTPTIPTSNGLNVFDISTTVKPSEVYIKYFSPLL